ncbi:MAG: short-chain dehydrogenase/reductase [Actinomycetia bacterium]|nr:short-chain dehydrogenase/reductase [Actinomycetes bacterium]
MKPMDALDFTGRSVIVTGGTRGIGAGIAHGFLAAGAQVLVCGRNEPAELPSADGRTAQFVGVDVCDPGQAAMLARTAAERFGRLDVVVNNAGGAPYADAATASPRLHAKVIALNLIAPLHVAQAANAIMQDQPGGGAIVMIGSVSGVRPSPGTAAYGAAKAGLHSLATSLAVEWAPKVRVNSVVVGPALTERSSVHYGDALAEVSRTVPLGRMALPQDVASACLFLASRLASYISGAALTVHGGGERPEYLAAVEDAAYPAQK